MVNCKHEYSWKSETNVSFRTTVDGLERNFDIFPVYMNSLFCLSGSLFKDYKDSV